MKILQNIINYFFYTSTSVQLSCGCNLYFANHKKNKQTNKQTNKKQTNTPRTASYAAYRLISKINCRISANEKIDSEYHV